MESKTRPFPVKDIQPKSVSISSLVLGGLVLLGPLLVYGWVFSRYAINIPKFDDHALKSFLLNLEKAESFRDKAYEFFRQHNEHRIVYDRLITWLDYNLTGKLNYIHLMIVGNLSLVLLLAVFVRALRRAGGTVWMALPVSLLLFNLSQWENMLWGMAALQNFTVIALAVATFYELAFRNRVSWLAVLLAVAATLTSGNGLMVWPVGLVLIFLRQDYVGVLRWLAALAITFRLYFLGYKSPPGNPADQGSLADQLHGWFLFNGASAEAFPVQDFILTCGVLGALLVGLTVCIGFPVLWKRFKGIPLTEWQLFLLGGTAFIVGTGLIVAFNRVGFGLGTLTTSRYKIYSLTLLSFLFTYGIARTSPARRLIVTGLATGFSFLIAFFSYTTYLDEAINLRQYLATRQFNWTYTQNRPVSTIDPDTRKLIDNAPAFYDSKRSDLYQIPTRSMAVRLDTLYKENGEYVLRLNSFPALGIRDEGAYLIARSNRRVYLFSTRQNLSGSRRRWFHPAATFGPGFTAQIPETELDAGTYDLTILSVNSAGEWQFYPTGRHLIGTGETAPAIKKNW
ncbi:hypothetical protein [Larkinella rosea]|uniref:Glycosyltransferase RgtA/B/C/D-like domain-containing protein n=1 Tax=Larkinella rosea TaxID=2025312 RepID=A0A3P1C134_9BACT|nr:hypothetical protein [Larkinella rosea]RRB07130.1 hypothetical protein EHT25_04935 [Larkinella rosea]